MVAWDEIDTVLLDMDGTLLDLNFDTHFWLEHVPKRYAEKYGIGIEQAREHLYNRYRSIEGTINWYSIDYWTEELGLDIALLKEEVDHLIVVHPYVVEFLEKVREHGKFISLVTNAHTKSLALKMERTQLARHFDAVICAHDFRIPKEMADFWPQLKLRVPFDKRRTLLVDDSLPVLRSAREYGIRWLLAVRKPDSCKPEKDVGEFQAISTFRDVMP